MSRFEEKINLNSEIKYLGPICQEVISKFGWNILEASENTYRCREKERFDYFNPVEITIGLSQIGDGTVLVNVKGINNGLGSVQEEYLRGQVQRLIEALQEGLIEKEKGSRQEEEPVAEEQETEKISIAEELETLSKLHTDGELSDEEFRKAKEKVLKE